MVFLIHTELRCTVNHTSDFHVRIMSLDVRPDSVPLTVRVAVTLKPRYVTEINLIKHVDSDCDIFYLKLLMVVQRTAPYASA